MSDQTLKTRSFVPLSRRHTPNPPRDPSPRSPPHPPRFSQPTNQIHSSCFFLEIHLHLPTAADHHPLCFRARPSPGLPEQPLLQARAPSRCPNSSFPEAPPLLSPRTRSSSGAGALAPEPRRPCRSRPPATPPPAATTTTRPSLAIPCLPIAVPLSPGAKLSSFPYVLHAGAAVDRGTTTGDRRCQESPAVAGDQALVLDLVSSAAPQRTLLLPSVSSSTHISSPLSILFVALQPSACASCARTDKAPAPWISPTSARSADACLHRHQ